MCQQNEIEQDLTSDGSKILAALLQDSCRTGARNVQVIADERGFIYQDDGPGLRDLADFAVLINQEAAHQKDDGRKPTLPTGCSLHLLLAHPEVEIVTLSSNTLSLSLNARRWRADRQYVTNWRDQLARICFPAPGMNLGVTCTKELTERFIQALTDVIQASLGCSVLLYTIINGQIVELAATDGTATGRLSCQK